MPAHIRALVVFVLTIGCVFIACRHHDGTSTVVEQVIPAEPEIKGHGLVEPGKVAILDSLIGSTFRLVKPLAGATLNVGGTSFIIPPGAVILPTLVGYSVSVTTPPPGLLDMPKRLFIFQPGGLVFLQDCQLIVPFRDLDLGTIDPGTLTCCYYNPNTRRYEPQPTIIDMEGERFIVTISHFSQYGFGRVQ